MKRCLVTGAGGLIGAHIVKALLGAGCDVVALVRPAGSRRALDGLSVEVVEADVSIADDALSAAARGCDTVFHAAAYFAYHGLALERMRELTVAGTENVLRGAASAGVKRAVVTSSSVVYGYHLSPKVPINEKALISAVYFNESATRRSCRLAYK
jgi:dihydroflavonol-4-reductase